MSGTRPRLAELESLRRLTRGDESICVAVLDGPVDLDHTCFVGARLTQLDTFVAASAAGRDPASQHGTHVASVIFGQDGSEVPGIAPRCRGLLVPIYSAAGDALACTQLDLARAIDLARAHGAHVINVSGGEPSFTGVPEVLLQEAIERCAASGILIVAAAGNDGCPCLHVPAALPSVLAVGATDLAGEPLAASNWGAAYRRHGLLAPGQDVRGAQPGGGAAARTGTSFAAATVSGIAALQLSLQRARGERPDPLRVRSALLATAVPCDPRVSGDCARHLAGRLDALAATTMLAGDAAAPGAARHPINDGLAVRPSAACRAHGEEEPMHDEPLPDPDVTPTASLHDLEPRSHLADAPPPAAPEAAVAPSEVRPSCGGKEDCNCGSSSSRSPKAGPSLAYVLGTVGYDFGSESRRDSLLQQSGKNLGNPKELLAYLKVEPGAAQAITWTLSLEAAVVYAVYPAGPFGHLVYERLRELLRAQVTEGADRVSIPGRVAGSVKLMNGQAVPALVPELRGIYSWSTPALVTAVLGAPPEESDAGAEYAERSSAITGFLDRVYYELRNLGIAPSDRAINFAATNAFQVGSVFSSAIRADLKLDSIGVERSPYCRPGADCWDVKLTFFNPTRRFEQARRVFRFTVDVSDVVPLTVGALRSWDVY